MVHVCYVWHGVAHVKRGLIVVLHVQDVNQQGLGDVLRLVQLLELLLHHNGLPGDLLARPLHHENPGEILEEQRVHPSRHAVRLLVPVVIVEDHDGGHHRARHHEHDAVKVGP